MLEMNVHPSARTHKLRKMFELANNLQHAARALSPVQKKILCGPDTVGLLILLNLPTHLVTSWAICQGGVHTVCISNVTRVLSTINIYAESFQNAPLLQLFSVNITELALRLEPNFLMVIIQLFFFKLRLGLIFKKRRKKKVRIYIE